MKSRDGILDDEDAGLKVSFRLIFPLRDKAENLT